jgi:endonuclease-3
MEMNLAEAVYSRLKEMHPEAHCELNYSSPFELLVAVILSAQCTDKRVNIVTEKLFKIWNTPEAFAAIEPAELEPHIFSCGFYRNKAKNIVFAARDIVANYGGRVPDNFDDLIKLAGVGRKTANVITSVAFGSDAIAVDTHVFRVSNRIGIADAATPEKTEQQLMEFFDRSMWRNLNHLLIFHGRYICRAQSPECGVCALTDICEYYKTTLKLNPSPNANNP